MKAAFHPTGCFAEIATAGGDFYQQGVVERIDDSTAEGATRIEADAESAGASVVGDSTVVRSELVRWVFGCNATLDCRANDLNFVLCWESEGLVTEFTAARDLDLRSDQVDTGYFFGDGMFDLDPRIDFDEIELVRFGIEEELNGSGAVVANFSGDS